MSNHNRQHVSDLALENGAFLIWGNDTNLLPEIDREAGHIHCTREFAYFLANVAIGKVYFHVSVGAEPKDWADMRWLREATFTTRMWGLLRLMTAAMPGGVYADEDELWTIDDGTYTLRMRHHFDPDDYDCVARERPERMWAHIAPADN